MPALFEVPSIILKAFLCVVSWRKSTEETRNLQISPLDARHFVAMAWDRVSASTITNCFAYCGVVESTVATSQESEDIENWDQLGVECSADDDLVTCGLRTVEEMVSEVATSQPEILSNDDEDDRCSSTSDEQPSTAETMHALDIRRCVVATECVHENTSAQFYAFQNFMLVDLAKKKTQKDIRDFFHCK